MKNFLKEFWNKYKIQEQEIHEITIAQTSGIVIASGTQLNSSVGYPMNVSIAMDNGPGAIVVSLEDLVQMGRTGYMVKIQNLSVEDKKWLKSQLDTESVDLV